MGKKLYWSTKQEGSVSAQTFWTSFFDGQTGDGIFGDLQLPVAPTRMFKPESQDMLLEVTVKPDDVYLVEIREK